MNILRIITATVCVGLCTQAFADPQDIDKEIAALAERLAGPIKEHSKTKVAVVDFEDLEGSTEGELGKYIAEQLTVDFVMTKRDFAVLDRANLKKILAEHKLTAKGLVDPDNAKKLGQFAGVDALILGTIIPKGTTSVGLNAKIITTDTAEIIGAARAEFAADTTVHDLISKQVAGNGGADGTSSSTDDKAQVVKSLGDMRVELQSLKIVNGRQYSLTMTVANQSRRTVWVALNSDSGLYIHGRVTDAQESEFEPNPGSVSGISIGTRLVYMYQAPTRFTNATELAPNSSTTATLKFSSPDGKSASSGTCRLQLEFLVGHEQSNGSVGDVATPNLVCSLEAN